MTLTFNEATHRYRLDGRPVPNVTTILNAGLPKGDALTRWAARVTAEHAVSLAVPDDPESPPFVVSLVEREGPEGAVEALVSQHKRTKNAAAARGTLVHDLAERIAHGEEVDVPDDVAPLVGGYVVWLDLFDPHVVMTETLVFSREHWYAGKFDLIADIGGVRWLLDLKTSRGVYDDTALQLAAYAGAERMIDRATGEELRMPDVERIGVVHVTADGTDLYDLGDINHAHREFLACLSTYRGVRRRSRDKLPGDPITPVEAGAAPMLWTNGDLS